MGRTNALCSRLTAESDARASVLGRPLLHQTVVVVEDTLTELSPVAVPT
jgi:hypothetical protein